MTIQLGPGEQKPVDVQLTPIAGPDNLRIRSFYVMTKHRYAGADGEWILFCQVQNMGATVQSGSLRCSGEVHLVKGWHVRPFDVEHSFTIEPWQIHTFIFDDPTHTEAEYLDDCWAKIETSWGVETRPMWFQAGWNTGSTTSIAALDIQALSAVMRYCSGDWGYKYNFYLRTPPSGTAEQELYRVCSSRGSNDTWQGCYFYAAPLLSGRQYYAEASRNGKTAQMNFSTK